MALSKDYTGYFFNPDSGKYYSPYTRPAPVISYNNPFGMFNMGMGQPSYASSAFGGYNMTGNTAGYQQPADPEGMISEGGKYYIPFTGDAYGITQGQRSGVDYASQNRQPFKPNVPSLESLFATAPQGMQQMRQFQGNAGANRFMGGLLGAMPTPESTTTTQAPSSSGAGRFL